MIKFLDLAGQYERLKPGIDAAIGEVIRSSGFINGDACKAFEREFAAWCEARYCVGVANGTDAIEIILEALELPAGSEVIVPANSFIGSSEPVTRSGLKVVFADADPRTYCLNVDDVRRRITRATSAIIPVHLYGHPADMDAIMALAAEHGLKVVEDCAQAHGATWRGRRVGTIGHAAAFSFYPGKNLGAYGDAGAIVTMDEALAKRCRMIANHGRVEKYNHEFEGRNSRLDGLQAAVLRVKLPHVEAWVEHRNMLAALYTELLTGVGDLALPSIGDQCRHAFHLYVVRTGRRDGLQEFLKARGIQTGVHYPIALSRLSAYHYLGQDREPTFANGAAGTLLSLPIGDHLDAAAIRDVAAAVREFYGADD